MIGLRLSVLVIAQETEMRLPGLFVKAYDKDLLFDDLLGSAITDLDGRAEIICDRGDFDEFFDSRPDVYFKVYGPGRTRLVHETDDAIRWNAIGDREFVIRVPLLKLVGSAEEPAVELFAPPGHDGERVDPAIGDALLVAARGLAPAAAHAIEVSDDQGLLFTSVLMTDRYGRLPESVLWPQFGLDDPRSDAIFTVAEADETWRGKEISVRIRYGEQEITRGKIKVGAFDRPFILNTDENGRMLNGFVDGEAAVAVEVHNLDHEGDVRAFLVPRQSDWRPGDHIEPVTLRDGAPAVGDGTVDAAGRARIVVAAPGALAPGAYDFVVRPVRYGFEDDEDMVLRRSDLVTRFATGVVIREEFWRSKVVQFGCVNMMPLAGRSLSGAPYFRYADAFAEGEDVWLAADPGALPPVNVGKMVAAYVVASKTAAQWNADTSLNHLGILGGNGSVLRFKTQAGCVNANKILVWAAASAPGAYDVVLDFGNNQSDPSLFVPDNAYNAATPPAVGDFIDGYMVPGFRIVKDPGVWVDPTFSQVGGFDYVNEGSITVIKDGGVSTTVPLTARVRFPADVAGATLPSQISAAKASYPLAVIVHGNGHTYEAYNYLLDHWAANGLIAASIHLNGNQTATDRARVLFEHINKLKVKFGAKAQNNIGVMGHSRGGEGVATAPRLNQQGGLGHTFNAVISLAPTNQHVDEHIVPPWATPYYVIYGSMDGDVDGSFAGPPLRNCGFALYDKAEGAAKGMLFVYGATHDRFLAPPGIVDLDYGWLSPADQAKAINLDAHHAIAKAYMTAYFRQQLLNDVQFKELFRGEWVPPSVATADGGKAKLFTQYRDAPANRKAVDDFEEAHTATSWQTGTLGGGVTQTGLFATPNENFLYVADNVHSPHETSGLAARWDNLGDALDFAVPAAHKNVSTYGAISLRLTQKYDASGAINPTNADQDLYVTLRDTLGNERSVRISKFGRIPYPHVRDDNSWGIPVTKSALCTIRIPLHAFTIECAGAAKVNLTEVERIALRMQLVATGEVQIDDLEFTA